MSYEADLKHGIDVERHGLGPISIGQEVGQTRQNASGRLRANFLQRGGENRQAAAGQHLGGLQGRVGATAVPVDVVPDVRIANHREDRRHDEEI